MKIVTQSGLFTMKCDASDDEKEQLLIVEPDALLRWSLVTYLSRWFQVIPADSSDQANFILDQYLIDALVVYDDVHHFADNIEHLARQRNAQTRVVRTVMNFPKCTTQNQHCSYIEKPFHLSRLAHLLGVKVDIQSSSKGSSDVR